MNQRLSVSVGIVILVQLIAIPAEGGLIYGVKSQAGATPSLAPTHLFAFNDNGTGFVDIGAITLAGQQLDVDGLAVSSAGLYGFRLDAVGSTLLSINQSTAVASTVGTALGGRDIRGAMFDSGGNLWAIDSAANELLRVNASTGTLIGSAVGLTSGAGSFDVSNITDIAQHSDGRVFLVDVTNVYTLDVNTGVLSAEFTANAVGVDALPGAAFATSGPQTSIFAYDVNGADDIYSFDLSAPHTGTLAIGNIIPTFNSGRGDLASVSAAPAPVPEPGSLALIGLGSLGLVAVRRSMRNRFVR